MAINSNTCWVCFVEELAKKLGPAGNQSAEREIEAAESRSEENVQWNNNKIGNNLHCLPGNVHARWTSALTFTSRHEIAAEDQNDWPGRRNNNTNNGVS